MKDKLPSILMVLILILSTLITTMPIMSTNASPNSTLDYETAIIKASDRLVALQADITEDNAGNGAPDDDPDDGGWNWLIDETATGYVGTGPSSENLYGLIALGILKTYKINPKGTYMTAMVDVYTGVNNRPEVDSAPDFTFLVKLSQLTGNPVYAELARGRYQTKISSVGDYNGDGEVNATDIAEYIRDARHSQGYDGLIPWDINLYVQAALALNSYYPGEGYDKDAIAMAEVIYQDMTGNPGYFKHPENQWFYYYVLGLSGALQAFTSTGTHLTGNFSAEEIKNFLIENQSNDGSWNSTSYWDGTNWYWAYPDIQSTAYAIMALISYGDSASILAATKAADWLISKQNPNGGWTVSSECPEVDSEVAQAIFDVIQAVGTVDVDHGSDGTVDLKTITIQQAINAAYPYDTIIVHEGTYNEGLLVDKEGLTILGLGNVILDGTGIDVHYGVHITADNVVIKNFHIANFTYGWGWGVQLTGADYCLLENLLVEKCNSGINLYRGSDHNIIQNCEINGIGGHGISIYGSDLGCTHNIIRNNRMIGCAWYMPYGKYHLAVMPIFSNASYNIIESNILTGTGVGYGMCLWGYTYGRSDMPEAGNLIRANNISSFDTAVYIRGHNLETGTLNLVTNTSILENNIEDNRIGVYVEGFDSNVIGLLHHNNIKGNAGYGALFNATYGTAILDARFNWWGDASGPSGMGPGAGDAISDYVTYSPWLGYPYGTIPMTYHVDPTGKIQDAINDASAGDTIIVHEGTYNENVVVNKALTMQGISKETTIIEGSGYNPTIEITANDVAISGFTVKQEKGLYGVLTDTSTRQSHIMLFDNIFYSRVQLYSVDNSQVFNNEFKVGSLSLWRSTGGEIYNNTISTYGVGIALYWCNETIIENNEIFAPDKTTYSDRGIHAQYCERLLIKTNTILNFTAGPEPRYKHGTAGAAIYLLASSNCTLEYNLLANNTVAIFVDAAPADSANKANYNNIEGNKDFGVFNAKHPTSGTWYYWEYKKYSPPDAIVDARFNWWSHETGPYHNTTWTYMGKPYGPNYGLGDRVSDYVLYCPWIPIIHDVAITEILVSPTTVAAGEVVTVNVTAKNEGNDIESFTVTAYYDDSPIADQVVTDLFPNQTVTLTFYWNTTGMPRGNYTIKAEAEIISGEVDVADNLLLDGMVEILWHDVAITNITTDRTWVYQGQNVNINVTITNNGDFAEIVTVTLYYNETANQVIGIQSFSIDPGENRVISFVWDTTTVAYCYNYTLSAVATITLSDNNPADNHFVDGEIKVRIMGDADGNGKVDMLDLYTFVPSFGLREGDPEWNPDLDLNRDGIIDMIDLYLTAKNFGTVCP